MKTYSTNTKKVGTTRTGSNTNVGYTAQTSELDIKNQQSHSYPSLVGFANLGYSTQSPNISGVFKTNTKSSDNGIVGPDKWYSYSTFGVSLRVPIFQRTTTHLPGTTGKLNLLKD
jgi:hypothetical protein